MSWLQRFRNHRKRDQDLDRELRYHVDRRISALIAEGVDPGEARRRAAIELGGAEQIKEACRDVRRSRWLEDLARDLRYGARLLKRSPLFAAAAVASLALGIGANTAIFSLMDLVMLRMMPVHEPERLVQFQKHYPPYGRGNISYPAYENFTKESRSFEGIFGQHMLSRADVVIGGHEEKACVVLVSGTYYPVLGVGPLLGRTFGTEVDRSPGESLVAVISHAYWQRRFGADPAAVGKTVQFSGKVFTIIGVTPREFHGTVAGTSPDFTIPLFTDGQTVRRKTRFLSNWLSVMGRLRNGVEIKAAEREVRIVFGQMVASYAKLTGQSAGDQG
jgi:hypothetical protein